MWDHRYPSSKLTLKQLRTQCSNIPTIIPTNLQSHQGKGRQDDRSGGRRHHLHPEYKSILMIVFCAGCLGPAGLQGWAQGSDPVQDVDLFMSEPLVTYRNGSGTGLVPLLVSEVMCRFRMMSPKLGSNWNQTRTVGTSCLWRGGTSCLWVSFRKDVHLKTLTGCISSNDPFEINPVKFWISLCLVLKVGAEHQQTTVSNVTSAPPGDCPQLCNPRWQRQNATNSGRRMAYCPECHKGFYKELHLEAHLRTHRGQKPNECWCCGKTYPTLMSLTHHRTHSGTKPFKCWFCGDGFMEQNHYFLSKLLVSIKLKKKKVKLLLL
uniref:Zinc finger protein 501-like n=1 Tax=Kryptolebias marmoratus TaxID=37003 RepID=A0A3Q2ZRV3_KRYMA